MPRALWTLLWLHFNAVIRRMTRQLRTPRGIVFFLIGIGVACLWVTRFMVFNHYGGRFQQHNSFESAPLAIFVFCVANLFTSAGDRAVTFTPAEVDFLFPGPFSRRSLLIYKLIKTGLATLFSSAIFAGVLGRYGGIYIYRLVGVWLIFQFMQLLAMTLALVQTTIGERLFAVARRWIFLLLTAIVALGLYQLQSAHHRIDLETITQLRDTRAARIALSPFVVFANVLAARTFITEFLPWSLLAAAIDLLMGTLVIGLDANYLETSASVSARRYARVSRVRRSGLSGAAKPNSAKWKFPMLPFMAGIGPIAWRQLTTALRTARTMLIIICIGTAVAGYALAHATEKESFSTLAIGLAIYFNLFLSQMLKFDFRGDLDYLDVLRSLPLHPTAIAAAQVIAPSVVISMIELLLVASIAYTGNMPPLILVLVIAFIIPLNLLTITTDNLIFLLFPFRQTVAVAGDMGMFGRKTIVVACRSLLLVLIVALSAGIGIAAWYLTNQSLIAAALAAWIPLVAAIAIMIWLIGVTFEKFDPSVNTPT